MFAAERFSTNLPGKKSEALGMIDLCPEELRRSVGCSAYKASACIKLATAQAEAAHEFGDTTAEQEYLDKVLLFRSIVGKADLHRPIRTTTVAIRH